MAASGRVGDSSGYFSELFSSIKSNALEQCKDKTLWVNYTRNEHLINWLLQNEEGFRNIIKQGFLTQLEVGNLKAVPVKKKHEEKSLIHEIATEGIADFIKKWDLNLGDLEPYVTQIPHEINWGKQLESIAALEEKEPKITKWLVSERNIKLLYRYPLSLLLDQKKE